MEKIQKRLKSKQRQPEQKMLVLLAYLSFVVSFFISFCCFFIRVQKTALIFTYARKNCINCFKVGFVSETRD